MTRISILTEDDMNDEQRSVIEYSSHSGQPHGGPYWAYIRNPKLMRIVQDMNRILTEGTLTANELSIIVLTVARHWSQVSLGGSGPECPKSRAGPERDRCH